MNGHDLFHRTIFGFLLGAALIGVYWLINGRLPHPAVSIPVISLLTYISGALMEQRCIREEQRLHDMYQRPAYDDDNPRGQQ